MTCPAWCQHTGDHAGDHWFATAYTPASRSNEIYVDQDGAKFPAVSTHITEFYRQGPLVGLHITGTSPDPTDTSIDFQADFSLEEAVMFAGRYLHALAKALDGQPSGLMPHHVELIRDQAALVVEAHRRESRS